MANRFWGLVGLGVLAMVGAHGCSSDDESPSPAGKSGKSGKGGMSSGGAGAAGEGGKGGGGGKAGSGKGGSSGSSSGKGGTGQGGESGGGMGATPDNGGTPPMPMGDGGGSGAGEAGVGAGAAAGVAGAGGEGGQAPCVNNLNLPLLSTAPATLDLTGLYTSSAALPEDVAPYVREFAPEYTLWSDGATKKRWAYIPKCTQIDTTDMDHWEFPVGTRFWKEFTVPSSGSVGDVRVETRFIHRYGPGADDWLFAAYQWDPNALSQTAGATIYVPAGVVDANGTTHDIPAEGQCTNCHGKLPERILGFSAFQLSHAANGIPGPSMRSLSNNGYLTVPAPAGFHPPGDAPTQAALGYLHANCGQCHNSYFAAGSPPVRMRLLTTQTTPETTDTYTTLVNVLTTYGPLNTYDRVEPGDHANSEIIIRMSSRTAGTQMPPIASEVVDAVGVQTISDWIDSLPP